MAVFLLRPSAHTPPRPRDDGPQNRAAATTTKGSTRAEGGRERPMVLLKELRESGRRLPGANYELRRGVPAPLKASCWPRPPERRAGSSSREGAGAGGHRAGAGCRMRPLPCTCVPAAHAP